MFLYSRWLALPLPIRAKIASHFGVARIRPIHVQDNRVIDDGYNIYDIEKILNPEVIKLKLNITEQNPDVIWDLVIAWANGAPVSAPLSVLPQEEAEQFEREYTERTGKKVEKEEKKEKKKEEKPLKAKKGKKNAKK